MWEDLTTMSATIGQFIAAKRKAANLTQAELGKALARYGHNYAPTTISGWENGANPPLDNPAFVDALALILKVSAVEIYQVAGFFSASSDVSEQQLMQLLQTATPTEREAIEQYAKFLISNRKRGS